MSAPFRHPTVLRRLAWVAPLAWLADLLLLIPSISYGRPVHSLVEPLFWLGVLTAIAGITFCMTDWKAARPQEYREVTQTVMWAITIGWVITKLRD